MPEPNKALERPQLTQWMRLILSNLKTYVGMRAGEVGEVPPPVEFKGQVANNMMDPGEQLAWCTWDYINQSQSAYARRYPGPTSSSRQTDQEHATLEEAGDALGESFVWRSVKFGVVGGRGRPAVADVPRGVDPCRLPTEWRLLARHPVWLPGGRH